VDHAPTGHCLQVLSASNHVYKASKKPILSKFKVQSLRVCPATLHSTSQTAIDRNTVIVDRPGGSPQAADPRFKKTMNSQSESPSQTQKCNIQAINDSEHEDNRQTHKTYHFENCGIVYMDSFNAHGVRMKNCGNLNNVSQVTCCFFFPFSLLI
jgi:hypothetical protein